MKSHKLFFSSHSLLFNWIVKYVVVILLSFAATSFVYQKAISTLEEEMTSTNALLLGNIQKNIESRLRDAVNLGDRIYTSNSFKALALSKDTLSTSNVLSLKELNDSFGAYKATNTAIEYFFVYFNNTEHALSSEGYFDKKRLYSFISGGIDIGEAELDNLLSRYHSRSFILVGKNGENSTGQKLYYIQSYAFSASKKVDASIVIAFDMEELIDISGAGPGADHGTVAIMDQNGTVLGGEQYFQVFGNGTAMDIFSQKENVIKKEIKGEAYAIHSISSKEAPLKYVLILPQSVFMEKIHSFSQTARLGIILFLLAGGITALFFAFRNYTPIRKLVTALSHVEEQQAQRGVAPTGKKEYEISYIQHMISNIINEKLVMRNELDEMNLALRERFVESLLKGKNTEEKIDEKLAEYKLQALLQSYVVVLLRIDDYGDFMGSGDGANKQNEKLAVFALKNVASEILNQKGKSFLMEMDNMIVCITSHESDPKSREELTGALEAIHAFIYENFKIRYTVAASGVAHKTAEVEKACKEAYKAMEYSFIRGNDEIIFFEEIHLSDKTYYYPMDTEQQLVNFIKTGNREEARKVIHDIFDKNNSDGVLSLQMVKCLVFDMVSTLIKVLHELQRDNSSSAFADIKPTEVLLDCNSLEETKVKIFQMLEEICSCVEINKKSHNTGLKNQILQYVDEHYWDVNLSIAGIAEDLKVNTKYMSRFFKEQVGCGLIEYVGKYRLKKARELMEAEDITIADIAQKVGFSNAVALIRAFKKYEGVTPGKYKDYLKNINNTSE